MMQLITQDHYGEFVEELAEMHRLRYRVFKRRLDWDVEGQR
jgi:N-acyl-L-homoserine lactone synthetase